MTGEVAQLISLITHYNFEKKNSKIDLFTANTTFQHCNELSFVIFRKTLFGAFKERSVASTTSDWFAHLKHKKIHTLNLVFQFDDSLAEDHQLAGMVGGGGNWFIEAKNDDFSDYWRPKWAVNPNRKEEDERIWDVTYGLTKPKGDHAEHPVYDIGKQRETLSNILTGIADFARANKATASWEKTFLAAKAALTEPVPEKASYQDMMAEGALPDANVQLLIAASQSFVFGGVGSWNDIGKFENEESAKKYDELSAVLYQVMNESIIAAVNER